MLMVAGSSVPVESESLKISGFWWIPVCSFLAPPPKRSFRPSCPSMRPTMLFPRSTDQRVPQILVVSHRSFASIEAFRPSKRSFHRGFPSIGAFLPSRLCLHRGFPAIETFLPSRLVFHRSFRSMEAFLPSKPSFHLRVFHRAFLVARLWLVLRRCPAVVAVVVLAGAAGAASSVVASSGVRAERLRLQEACRPRPLSDLTKARV